MPSTSGAIRAGRAFVELFADDSKLVRGLNVAGVKLKRWGENVTAIGSRIGLIGGGLLAPIVAAAKVFADTGSDMLDMSQRTGIAVEQLSTLKYAAEQSGTSMEALEGGVGKMQKALASAASGSKESQKAFSRLGLSVDELSKLSPDEQFKMIADRIAAIEDPAKRTAAAMAIFGRGGAELLPLMNDGAKGISALQAEAVGLGRQMSTTDAQAAEKFGDTIDRVKGQLTAVAIRIGAAAAPALEKFADWLVKASSHAANFIDKNRGIIEIALKIGAGLVIAGGALTGFGLAMRGVGSGLGVLAKTLPLIAPALGLMKTVGLAAFGALISPVGLVSAAVVGLGGVLLTQTETGRGVLAKFGSAFGAVKEDAVEAWGGITAAVASGDLGQAAAVAWGLMKLEATRAVVFLESLWADFATSFSDIFTNVWTSIKNGWAGFVGGLAKLWEKFIGWISGEDTSAMVASIDQGTQEQIAANNKNAEQQRSANAAKHDANIEALTRELAVAREAFSDTVNKAKLSGEGFASGHVPESIRRMRAEGSGEVGAMLGKSAGTFNGMFAGQQLSGQQTDKQIAENTKQSAKYLKDMARRDKLGFV
jgi:hypothetical protein|tara:strand:+ start:12252 stop:14033 length:1782 start_codon:yes stop_codon:yes gene_type:complete